MQIKEVVYENVERVQLALNDVQCLAFVYTVMSVTVS
jgi:hypothetical protein